MVAKNKGEDTRPSVQTEETAEVMTDGFSENELRDLDNMFDVMRAQDVANIADVMGTGFSVLEDKNRLIGVEFVIVRYGVHEGENGQFTTIHVVTTNKEKFVVNDGSTGIHAQLAEYKERAGRVCPLYVPRGLRVSEYDFTDDNGTKKRARTYYLNTSK